MRGRPLHLKCPRCKRGKYGRPKQVCGCMVQHDADGVPIRRIRRGARMLTLVSCRDCKHEWWSTVPEMSNTEYCKRALRMSESE